MRLFVPNLSTRLPLTLYASAVAAGFPSPAEDYVEGQLDLNEHLIKRPAATFLVRAVGDSMTGAGIYPGDILVVDRSIALAHARKRIDEGEDIMLDEIALLGGLATQTVRNAASNGAFGRVTAKTVRGDVARSWLEGRETFQPSRWRDADDDQSSDDGLEDDVAEEADEYVFVPKHADGDLFLPTLAKPLQNLNGALGYTIGSKGQERDVADYYEALEALNRMPTPRWRRPNDKGVRGIVTAPNNRSFERVRKSDLDRMIEDVRASSSVSAA